MLILTRKTGQKITITPPGCNPIELLIAEVSGKQVRVGIAADREVHIARNELLPGKS